MKQVPIPTQLNLYAQTIVVEPSTTLVQDQEAVGLANFENNTIQLQIDSPKYPRSRRQIEEAYLHELTHFILQYMEHELRFNEPFVDQFSKLLHQAMTTSKGNLLRVKPAT